VAFRSNLGYGVIQAAGFVAVAWLVAEPRARADASAAFFSGSLPRLLEALRGAVRLGPGPAVIMAIGLCGWVAGQRLVAVGVTGRIASGKSTVTRAMASALGSRGVVVDADEVSRFVQRPGSALHDALVLEFGREVCDGEGRLDRRRLGAAVFGDRDRVRRLNRLTHPAIGAEVARRFAWHSLVGGKVVVIDAALLLASPVLAWLCFPVVVVRCGAEEQMRRLQSRDGDLSAAEARARIDAQPPADELVAMAGAACVELGTDGSLDDVQAGAEAVAAAVCSAWGV